jgi:DNA-binding MarR family transcriptional regulator
MSDANSPPQFSRSPCTCSSLRRAPSRSSTTKVGLRVTQLSLLRTLQRNGKLCIGELAALTLLDRTVLSCNLDPLVARELVAAAAGEQVISLRPS